MEQSDYYMSLPKELSGSISKNRFRMELFWGIGKLIDKHKDGHNYAVVFDFKCDVEVHSEDTLEFFQIKTIKNGNFNYTSLCKKNDNSKNSILGKLYALYSPPHKIILAVVSNQALKIGRKPIDSSNICFAELDSEIKDEIEKKLKSELAINHVDFNKIFFIHDAMDFINPKDAILGKLTRAFLEIKGEEPRKPNALFNSISDLVEEKATYELDLKDYKSVIQHKGVTRNDFDKILEAHREESITGIEEAKKYISSLNCSAEEKRKLNKALTDYLRLAIKPSEKLRSIRSEVFEYIKTHASNFFDVETALNNLADLFDNGFDVEFDSYMKKITYIILYKIYEQGGEI